MEAPQTKASSLNTALNNVHQIKVFSADWYRLCEGSKTFEVRQNDRGYQKADRVVMGRLDDSGSLTTDVLFFVIGYVQMLDGQHVAFSLLPVAPFEFSAHDPDLLTTAATETAVFEKVQVEDEDERKPEVNKVVSILQNKATQANPKANPKPKRAAKKAKKGASNGKS